jgi:hypothetical protein
MTAFTGILLVYSHPCTYMLLGAHPCVVVHAVLAENLCEGLDHAEAGPLDVADAAEQLQAATEHVLQLDAVMPQGWADSHYEDKPAAADPPGQAQQPWRAGQ